MRGMAVDTMVWSNALSEKTIITAIRVMRFSSSVKDCRSCKGMRARLEGEPAYTGSWNGARSSAVGADFYRPEADI